MYTNVDVFINNKIIASVTCNVFLLYFNEKGITLLMQSVLLLLLLWYTGNERTTNPFELASYFIVLLHIHLKLWTDYECPVSVFLFNFSFLTDPYIFCENAFYF